MSDGRMTVGNVEVSHLYDLVADFPMTLDQLFPTVPAAAWEPYRRQYPDLFGPGNVWRYHAGCYLIRSGGGRSWWIPALARPAWVWPPGSRPAVGSRSDSGRRAPPGGCRDGGLHPSAPRPCRLEPPGRGGPVSADLPASPLRRPSGGLGYLPAPGGPGGASLSRMSIRPSRRWSLSASWI